MAFLPNTHPDDEATVAGTQENISAAISVSEINHGATTDHAIEALARELAKRVEADGNDWRAFLAVYLLVACDGSIDDAQMRLMAGAAIAAREQGAA